MDSEVFEKLSPTKLFFRCAVPSMITMAFSALSVFLRILANGSSEFFSNISMSVMSVVYNFFLLKHGGTTALAALSDHIFFRHARIPDRLPVHPHPHMATRRRMAQRIFLVHGKCCRNDRFGFDNENKEGENIK